MSSKRTFLKLKKAPLTQGINFWLILIQNQRTPLCHLRVTIMSAKKNNSFTRQNAPLESQSLQTRLVKKSAKSTQWSGSEEAATSSNTHPLEKMLLKLLNNKIKSSNILLKRRHQRHENKAKSYSKWPSESIYRPKLKPSQTQPSKHQWNVAAKTYWWLMMMAST